jgi:hypothetical protein
MNRLPPETVVGAGGSSLRTPAATPNTRQALIVILLVLALAIPFVVKSFFLFQLT